MTDIDTGVEPSPFEGPTPTRARRAFRIALSVALVATAIVTALLLTRDAPVAATAGHNHAAPAGAGAAPVALDAEAARRIGVTFAAVTAGPITTDVRSLGQVTWDETRATAFAPKVEGWVERLHVDFTGQEVREGQALLDIYSPMLVAAQEELLLAARLVRDVAGGTDEARRGADEMLASARRRLRYWDIPAPDIEQIELAGRASRVITLRATSSGVVVEKSVVSGQRVMAGETLYRLADLRTVWVDGQVFEHDLALVRTGQRVSVEIQAWPGERWAGTVTYVYPLIDPATRTARLRVELANAGRRLKPGMFATLLLAGSLRQNVLSVPRSAVLATGARSIVFLKAANGTLEPREVVAGVASDDRLEIRSGLIAGDTVVASATFLIDAESNLKAALGSMTGMPGMDAPRARPVPAGPDTSAMPGMKMEPPGKNPPAVDHSSHGMADTLATPKPPVRRED